MGGIGLSRLWASHPRIAFVLHLMVTLLAGIAVIATTSTGTGWGTLFVVGAFLLMAVSLVFLTWSAAREGWQPDHEYISSGTPMVSPRAAWVGAATRERVLWLFFAVAFLSGLVLLLGRSIIGAALILGALLVAIVAMRAD
jgi:hypothetical protein